ncbi:MAG TPA: hypothetical protein VNN72_03390 [Polyangiaceae bacterium]|nr:hypothetical protein [Polyangiaceae bacterium]
MAKATKATNDFAAAELGTTADDALAALERAGERAEALVDAWVSAGNAAAVNAAADGAAGKARKAARRGLNVLKARGVKVPETARVVSVAGDKGAETLEAWLLAPDGNGASLVTITSRSPTSRYKAVLVLLASGGILRVNSGDLSQSELKDTFTRAVRGAYRPVKIPLDYARSRIGLARSTMKAQGLPEPFGFAGVEALLGTPGDAPVPHPLDAEGLELGDEDAKDLAKTSASLHMLPEFASWLPARPAVDELLAKVGETLTPGEKPDQAVFDAKLKEQLLAATDRYFTPERRAELVTVMKDSALSVLARDGEERALAVVAAMKTVEKAGLITDPPREVPFLLGFFEKAIAVLLAQGNGQLRVPISNRPVEPAAAG